MKWRWTAWLLGVTALAMLALFPLRIGLGLTGFERVGFSARQVAGTIWYGRLGELNLRRRPLGTFEVALDPLPLLLGTASIRFHRMDGIDGPLGGRLVAGARIGLIDASGRVAMGDMFAPLPIDALILDHVTLLFRGGRCVEAAGSLTPVIALPVAAIDLGTGLRGTVQCEGQRARIVMTSASGRERVQLFIRGSGQYRGWIIVRDPAPDAALALSLFGFRPSFQGMTLSVDGRL